MQSKTPFEQYVVQSVNVNEFFIRVASPEAVRSSLEVGANLNSEDGGVLMMKRYLFIADAIREKLEREK